MVQRANKGPGFNPQDNVVGINWNWHLLYDNLDTDSLKQIKIFGEGKDMEAKALRITLPLAALMIAALAGAILFNIKPAHA
jgi:hypothetical protein